VVKAGHIAILAGPGAAGQGKIQPADTEAWLEGLDLAQISKL